MTETATLLDWLAAFLLVSGAFFSLVAGVGLLVLPDLLARMHAAAKPQVLGLLLMLAGLAIEWRSWVWLPVLFLAWVTQMVTAPVASHLVGRTGYRTKHARRELLHRDELAAVVRRAEPPADPGPRRAGARPRGRPGGPPPAPHAGRRPDPSGRRPSSWWWRGRSDLVVHAVRGGLGHLADRGAGAALAGDLQQRRDARGDEREGQGLDEGQRLVGRVVRGAVAGDEPPAARDHAGADDAADQRDAGGQGLLDERVHGAPSVVGDLTCGWGRGRRRRTGRSPA